MNLGINVRYAVIVIKFSYEVVKQFDVRQPYTLCVFRVILINKRRV